MLISSDGVFDVWLDDHFS